ncbi:MAG: hypothetical protein V1862_04210 [Methanobacteriota archaeon]
MTSTGRRVLTGGIKVGEVCIVRTGERIILPASIPHAVDAEKSFKMMLTMIHA